MRHKPKVFVSYRRSDTTSPVVQFMCDRLESRLGEPAVVTGVPKGGGPALLLARPAMRAPSGRARAHCSLPSLTARPLIAGDATAHVDLLIGVVPASLTEVTVSCVNDGNVTVDLRSWPVLLVR